MKKKEIMLHSLCTLLVPVVLLFTMGFSERMVAKNIGGECYSKNNCCSENRIEKKSDKKPSDRKESCDKMVCVHFFSIQNDKKRKVPANDSCC